MKIKRPGFTLIILLLLGVYSGILVLYWLIHPKEAMEFMEVKVGQTLSGNTGPINALLIANNARDATSPLSLGTAGGQADILIVAHVDPSSHKVTFISIPRDTLIAMPEWKEPIPKIKSAFELGLHQSPEEGPLLAMKYVSMLTGLKMDGYIVTDFQGFIDAINAVGGITIQIPARLYDPAHSGADFQPGLQTLNGEQALAYIRIRQNNAGNAYRTNDFQRQNAELEVLDTLKTKLLSSETNISQLRKLLEAWKQDIATNLSTLQLLGLGLETTGSQIDHIMLGSVKDSMDIASTPLPGVNQSGYLKGAYYDVLDPAEIDKRLKPYGSTGASTGLLPLPEPGAVTVNFYGSQWVANKLQKTGFIVHWLGSQNGRGPVKIYYPYGQFIAACSLARTLGTANEMVLPSRSATEITIDYP